MEMACAKPIFAEWEKRGDVAVVKGFSADFAAQREEGLHEEKGTWSLLSHPQIRGGERRYRDPLQLLEGGEEESAVRKVISAREGGEETVLLFD